MVLTQNVIDILTPTHDRTSCDNNDTSLENGYKNDIGYPRCNRCYLLLNIESDTENLDMDINVFLSPK